MEARHCPPIQLAPRILSIRIALRIFLGLGLLAPLSYTSAQPPRFARQAAQPQFQATTEHFIVTAADATLARRVGKEAERFRKELAMEWLGTELGPWEDRCPIIVELGMHAGGETSFAFIDDGSGQSRPVSWQMKIFGPPDRLLDAVLPHEITHTIFATHFGRPLPRWADEGACTTVEHESERSKNHQMLIDFLTAQPSRGIPFNRMFTMKNYPHDILPLYAQGYSVAKFLILQKGRRYFLDYVAAGMSAEAPNRELQAWDSATEKFYGYRNLSDLQLAWKDWVSDGSAQVAETQIGRVNDIPVSTKTEIERPAPLVLASNQPASINSPSPVQPANFTEIIDSRPKSKPNSASGSWYARQANRDTERVAANRESLSAIANGKLSAVEVQSAPAPTQETEPCGGVCSDSSKFAPATIWR